LLTFTKVKMLGIVIVTMNRSEFVIRQLAYYARIGCPYTIYIGDSSNDDHLNKIGLAIEKLENQLKIVHRLCPGKNTAITMKELLGIVKEKYAAYSGDDDFLIPNSLGKCITFLEAHSEYSTAQGKGIVFSLDRKGPYGNVESMGSYFLKDNECETSTQRLFQYASEGWNSEFSVHRTEEFLQACEARDILPDGGLCESLTNSISFIQGKSKQLDCLYLFRQVHSHQYPLPLVFERLISPNWYPSYQIFHQQLTTSLMKYEGITSEDASERAKQAFFRMLLIMMRKTLQRNNLSVVNSNFLRQKIKQIPGIKPLYSLIVKKLLWKQDEFQLERLLQTSSPYHAEFMSIYKIITSSAIFVKSELQLFPE
jgi:glycosyltransferase domain-containing protein